MQRILSIYNANVDLNNAQNLGLGDFPQDAPSSLVQHVSLKADDRVMASYVSPFSSHAAGGEWDVVLNVFVRDETMGFLSDPWRINFMLTRAKLFELDILDATFFDSPKGPRASLISNYRDNQQRNGAVMVDNKNWGKGHNVRKCSVEATMGVALSDEEIELAFAMDAAVDAAPVAVAEQDNVHDSEDDAAQDSVAQADAVEAETVQHDAAPGDQVDELPDIEQDYPAREADYEIITELQAILEQKEQAVVPKDPVATIEEDDDDGEEEEEAEMRSPKKRRRGGGKVHNPNSFWTTKLEGDNIKDSGKSSEGQELGGSWTAETTLTCLEAAV
ncbi:hypothetical protein J7T55_003169 [Diaporthe amygdali]|uniref:uncharacterized protein n=1 Tax=Phomopsis amygdali TaxID=1214568 RepID=UPI0022FE4CD6|nr:uncharacterized protein J7T55_003169 [Diaporthe amygdali]KAJ0122654.1 hypothetical protein J7T55_003169 [Diaporthe amygdali]